MAYEDKTLTCRDCGSSFTFTGGEQEFYASRGLTNNPSRCPDRRRARKQGGGGHSGGDSYGGGRGSYGGGSREMYEVTCDSCGKPAKVPFQPRGDRPVYCSDCFQSQRSSRPGGGYGGMKVNTLWPPPKSRTKIEPRPLAEVCISLPHTST